MGRRARGLPPFSFQAESVFEIPSDENAGPPAPNSAPSKPARRKSRRVSGMIPAEAELKHLGASNVIELNNFLDRDFEHCTNPNICGGQVGSDFASGVLIIQPDKLETLNRADETGWKNLQRLQKSTCGSSTAASAQ